MIITTCYNTFTTCVIASVCVCVCVCVCFVYKSVYCGSVMIPKSCLPCVQVSYDKYIHCFLLWSHNWVSVQFTIAAIFLIWAHTLCKHVTCIHSPGTGKLLKQDHYQGRDLPQGVEGVEWPIIPRSHPVVQYPCHRLQHHHVCACVYYIHKCQYECVHAVCPAPRHSLTEHVHT